MILIRRLGRASCPFPDGLLRDASRPSVGSASEQNIDKLKEPTPVIDPEPGVTPDLLDSTGGGDNFSVYNPDPTRLRTKKDYQFPFKFTGEDLPEAGDYIVPPRTGVMGLYDQYKALPTGGKIGLGATSLLSGGAIIPAALGVYGIGKGISSLLPPNRRGILENELLGAGVMLDDIGRVVATDTNTPEGIMAGYNANLITDKTFDKRQSRIEKTLQDKYGLTDEEIQDALAGAYTGDVQSDLIGRIFTLNQARDLFTRRNKIADSIYQRQLDKKEEERQAQIDDINRRKRAETDAAKKRKLQIEAAAQTQGISRREAERQQQAVERDSAATESRGRADLGSSYDEGTYCFDPNTLIQMADGSEKKIKEIQLGDQTKGGEVTGVFQFKASDEIHDYKGVTVAGSHYVKENGRFIMVKDSPISIKIDKIPVVYSLDTTGRRIFINDIEFADYNGDGIAKGFLANAGVDLTGFDKEVLRQVEHRLI